MWPTPTLRRRPPAPLLAPALAAALGAACAPADAPSPPARAEAAGPADAPPDTGAADPERAHLRAAAPRVRRRGLALEIAPESGAVVRLVDDTAVGSPAHRRHVYLGPLRGTRFHLVGLTHFVGHGYLLVHARTGRRLEVDARPALSPDGTRLATAAMDLVSGFGPTRLAVLRLDGDTAREEFAHEPARWGPDDARWSGPDTVRFTAHHLPGDAPGPMRATRGLLVRAAGRWRLVAPRD